MPIPSVHPIVAATARLVEEVRRDLETSWQQDDKLLDKLFPITPDPSYRKARKALYNERKNVARWKRIPNSPKSLPRLYSLLTNLMNDILLHCGISSHGRLFLDTHKQHVVGLRHITISPTIYLAGFGPEFATTLAELPRAIYHSGICAIEVLLDSEDQTEVRDRLAVYAHQMFQHQQNRRFTFGLIITQSVFTLYTFDHSGAVASEPCNYHKHPDQFCAVISGLASDARQAGFDLDMFREVTLPYAKLRTFEPVGDGPPTEQHYKVIGKVFQFSTVVGRGTVCWLASGPGESPSMYVIKDAWIAPSELAGRESEGSLLRHAMSVGITTGVAQIRHFEEVRRSASDASDLDTVVRNRCLQGTFPEENKLDRTHTRIVMAPYAKTFDRFASRMELLLAFHDAVIAHRKLHDVAGILHRDISVRNILINPGGVEGNRGILIDFDHAIRVGDTSPYSTKRKIGTWRFMSRMVLDASGSHTYLDDLESFYYVLCWILVAYEGPGIGTEVVPPSIACWDDPAIAFSVKHGGLLLKFRLPVAPWFGASLRELAAQLHQFFRVRFTPDMTLRSPPDPRKDYEDFLAHIRQAITSLEKETDVPDLLQKRERPVDSDEETEPYYSPPPSRLPRAPRQRIAQPTFARTRQSAAHHRALAEG